MSRAHSECQSRFLAACLAAVTACVVGFQPTHGTPNSSDPIRNVNPERATPPEEVENPIYYDGPFVGSTVGDVGGVVPEALLQEFLKRHSGMDYPRAVEAAIMLIEAVPDRPIGHYNLACALARLGRVDEAFDALENAVQHGWRDVVHWGLDPDLAVLRSDARYATLLDELKSRIEREQMVDRPLRRDSWEDVVGDLVRETPGILQRHHVPGASVALIHDGQVVWSTAFGSRSTVGDSLLKAEDRFRLRAPLHLLAMAACDQLQRSQKLEFASLILDAAQTHANVATDRASDGAVGVLPASVRERRGVGRSNGSEFVANVRPASRMFSRNSVYGYWRLAVEAAAEVSFPRYCEQALFEPLMLRNSSFAEPADQGMLATGHSALGTPLRPNVMQGEFAPGGCIYMNAADVARLVAASIPHTANDHTSEGDLPIGASSIFGDVGQEFDAIGFARTIEMATRADNELDHGLELAVRRRVHDDHVAFEMHEAAAGIVLLARWHPSARQGIVILANSVTAQDAVRRIAHLALGGE